MDPQALKDMTISEIMQRWPSTLGVFVDLGMHCIGCPIGIFHTPVDAAVEHGLPLDVLLAELHAAIEGGRVRKIPIYGPRRSGRADAAPE